MADVVEFYITCNPPLLPRGVSEVIRRVQDAEGLLEILYEPRSPWFKCIALSSERRQITAAVQDNLLAIAEDDVDALDFDEKTDGDISIISPDPRMTSWHEYKQNGSGAYAFADVDIFPEFIAESKYKTIWYDLEDHHPATFDSLLALCGTLDGSETALDAEQFQLEYKCRISYNLRQTVLYIGSDESREVIDTVLERLESMLQEYVQNLRGKLPQLLPPAEVIPAAEMRKPIKIKKLLPPLEVVPAAEMTKSAEMMKLLTAVEVIPAAEIKEPVGNDPFDVIPSDVNKSLPSSIAFQDPFNNSESLI